MLHRIALAYFTRLAAGLPANEGRDLLLGFLLRYYVHASTSIVRSAGEAERHGMSTSDQNRPLLDQAALALQALRGAGRRRTDVLLRIDNTAEAAAAPYQFDAAAGLLHRRGCRAIPEGAPLYGRWHLGRDDLTVACKRCKPLPDETKPSEPTDRADLLLGCSRSSASSPAC